MLKVLAILVIVISCSNRSDDDPVGQKQVPGIHQNIDGCRIAWDYSTMVKVAPATGQPAGYYGYARLVQLHDGRLACVYETSAGNIELVFSNNLGQSWGDPQTIFQAINNISMAVPEIIELSDHSILVACNPRPRKPYTDDRKFGIKVRKSKDGGHNWLPEQLIYEAQSTFENGCWEPSFVQLPNGEVQLFFANEGVYTTSNEQNISMLKSMDFGESWSANPVIVGFRKGHRDGMPVPLLLPNQGELLVAVEDNKVGEFKPTIYHEKLVDNWGDGYVSENDPRRSYQPLSDLLSNETYAGAPYLARLGTGEVLLSYQSNIERNNQWNLSSMVVEVGDNTGTLFSKRTVPFEIPLSKSGLWNSISVIENNTPVALTSTNAWSNSSTEVWMIKGHVIPELAILQGTANVDGQLNDDCWNKDWPYFIGHKSNTQMNASLCADENNLYLAVSIDNLSNQKSSGNGIVLLLDTERKGYEKPHHGIFAFTFNLDGSIKIEEGDFGGWIELKENSLIPYKIEQQGNSCNLEAAIPLVLFKKGFQKGKPMGLNFVLKYKLQTDGIVEESISANDKGKPYTWCPVWRN